MNGRRADPETAKTGRPRGLRKVTRRVARFWHDAPMQARAPTPPSISCVLPAYNEGHNLRKVVPRVVEALQALTPDFEILVVNDGSRDDTATVARALCGQFPGLVLIDLSRNFGKEAALSAGIDAARGDVVILMDADGQHPTAMLGEMLERWRQGSDVVYAVRRSRDDQSRLQARLVQCFYKLLNWGASIDIPPNAGDFRLMDRKVVEALQSLPERNRFMKGLYAWVGFTSTAIDYEPLQRLDGKSKFNLRGSFTLALTGIVAFSAAPLRALAVGGCLIALFAMLYGAFVVVEHFYFGIRVPGYATIVVAIMFFSGVQLLSIGILAEYIGRIYDEVKQRPRYLIQARLGQGLQGADQRNAPAP